MQNVILHTIEDFLPESNIEMCIAAADNYSSGVGTNDDPNGETGYRSAIGLWLNSKTKFNADLRNKISEIIRLPVSHFEDTHIIKYPPGGEYKRHYDSYEPDKIKRKYTALVYLNDDFEGGETEFTKANIKIKPKRNKLIIWQNSDDNGHVIEESEHAGLPVISGNKYILVIWICEQEYAK